MVEAVKSFFEKHGISVRKKNLLLAVSGGADSMAMLHLFHRGRAAFGVGELSVCHFNHGLRGRESDLDETLVREFCGRLDIPVFIARGEMSKRQKPQGHGIESWAREMRYAFFFETAKRLDAVDVTAHHRDDQAETVLFRLSRGTGIGGAAGMRPFDGGLLRPFLEISREAITAYCENNGIPYREDASNRFNRYARNRIRNRVLPELTEINSRAAENLAKFSAVCARADDYIRRQAAALLDSARQDKEGYRQDILAGAEEILRIYMIRQIYARAACKIGEAGIRRSLALLQSESASLQIGKNLFFTVKSGLVSVGGNPPAAVPECAGIIPLKEGRTRLFDGTVVFIKSYAIMDGIGAKSRLPFPNVMDCDKIKGSLYFRSRRSGDYFSSAKRRVGKSVKKLYNEMGIPAEKRWSYPLLADEAGVVWIRGAGVATRVFADETARRVLAISVVSGGCGDE